MNTDITSDLFIVLVVLAFIAVAQFIKGRKMNLMLMSFTASKLEEVLKPKDKIYQWIGLYVGYRAVFKLMKGSLDRAEVTVILMPRQSLLYYPISLLTSRFDRIFLVFCYNEIIPREAHIVRKGYYRRRIEKVIKNASRMRIDRINIKGIQYYLVYEDANTVNKLLKLVKNLSDPSIVNHLAIVPKNRTLYIAARIKVQLFEELLNKAYELALSLS